MEITVPLQDYIVCVSTVECQTGVQFINFQHVAQNIRVKSCFIFGVVHILIPFISLVRK